MTSSSLLHDRFRRVCLKGQLWLVDSPRRTYRLERAVGLAPALPWFAPLTGCAPWRLENSRSSVQVRVLSLLPKREMPHPGLHGALGRRDGPYAVPVSGLASVCGRSGEEEEE